MADQTSLEEKRQTLESLRQQMASLEAELGGASVGSEWNPEQFYTGFYVTVGFLLGGVAAMMSLLFNVIGSTIAGKHSLEIIRVYLTFPLGEQALKLQTAEGSAYVIDDGVILALGCCLYIGTGMVLGTVFHWGIARFALTRNVIPRLIWGIRVSLSQSGSSTTT
ncbi:MAG: hypothetical protein R3C20_13375 [Planctomycetaceae bacterium]